MKTAYLTIDDIPTKQTPEIIDFLVSIDVKPLMFCWGERLEEYRNEAIYALRKGAVLQNHSYSHPHFSELSIEEAKEEILRNEKLIESVYEEAGIKREYKLFRFPYGDQGGDKKDDLQKFLKEQGFAHIDDSNFEEKEYERIGQKGNRDVLWTFDFAEYNIRRGNPFTFDDVVARTDAYFGEEKNKYSEGESGKASAGAASKNIILIHDHTETEECCPGYFKKQIKLALERGVRFVDPVVYK